MSLPVLEKCCCVSLRRGLLVWGYAKMVLSLIIILQLTMISIRMSDGMSEDNYVVIFLKNISTAVPDVLALPFSIVLIIAAHKRNLKLMKVYYYYSIITLATYIVVILLAAVKMDSFQILYEMVFQYTWAFVIDYYMMLVVGVVFILVQAYIILLLRSEVHHLYNRDCTEDNFARQKSSASFKAIETPPLAPATEVVNITTDI